MNHEGTKRGFCQCHLPSAGTPRDSVSSCGLLPLVLDGTLKLGGAAWQVLLHAIKLGLPVWSPATLLFEHPRDKRADLPAGTVRMTRKEFNYG